jgi:hypothetical protein
MTERQISIIRRYIKENPAVTSNLALAEIIERKSTLGLSVGSLRKYIATVKATPDNVVETKAKSLAKGDTPKIKGAIKNVKAETPKCPTFSKLYFSYSHIKDQDLVNHIKTVLKDNNVFNNECSSIHLTNDLLNELSAYGVSIGTDEKLEFIEEEETKSSYTIMLKDPSHYTPVDQLTSADKVTYIHEHSHLYQGFLDLLSLAVPTEAVDNKNVTLFIDVKYHTPGTSNISLEDAQFYLSHFRNSFNGKVILVVDQDDFDLLNSFKGFAIDEVKFRILEDELDDEFDLEFEEEDED